MLALSLVMLGLRSKGSTEFKVSGNAIAVQLTQLLAGTKAHFNSDRKGRPGCYLLIGAADPARRFEFSLPDRVKDLGFAGQIIYRIRDINLSTIKVVADERAFTLIASFESEGVELKGSHSRLGDAAVPDIELNNMQLRIKLIPVATAGGSISYESPEVSFSADVDNTFVPRFRLLGKTIDIMDTLTNYRNQLCRSVQAQIQHALNESSRKEALARQVALAIGPGSSRVETLRWEGTDLIVVLR